MPTTKNNTLALHATIALEIKAAKKGLFARHRAGMTLAEALRLFRLDIEQRFEAIAPGQLAEVCPRCRFGHCHETTEPDTTCASCGFIHCSDQVDDDDHVTVTLPNGEQVELYGDAADLAKQPPRDIHPKWIRLSDAIAEIVTNEATPESLKSDVVDFLMSNSSELWYGMMITPPIIQKILIEAAVLESDRKEAKANEA